MSAFARALEFFGLLIVAAGLFVGVARDDVRTELALLALGGGVFLAGYFIGGRAEGR